MNEAVIFTIVLLCFMRNEDLEKLNSLGHPQAVAEQGELMNESRRTESKSFSL